MSLNFTTDTSVQLNYSSFGFATPTLDNFATSNYVNTLSTNNSNYTTNASNALKVNIDAKQDKINAYVLSIGSVSSLGFSSGTLTLVLPNNYSSLTINNLTTSTSFIYKGTELSTSFNAKQNIINSYTITGGTGGSLIFTIGTGNLTLAMPNNYTATMSLSNLITPTSFIYKGTELSTSLNAKQNTLTAATSLLGIGSNINALDYNKITLNKPSVFPPDVANIYIKSEVNQLITNTSNYSLNISNILKANIDGNNTTTNTSIGNTSNYASNISNVLLVNYNSLNTTTNTNISNYASNISNVLLVNYNSLNTTTNTNISNYASNISNVLLVNYNSLNTTTNTNISNYASNISNILTIRDATNLINSSNYSSNVSNVLLTNMNDNFLKLSGGTMTGGITGTTINLTTSTSGNNPLYIRSTNTTANNCIQIQNNGAPTAYIGVAGSAFGGNYANNLFIESASTSIIFNTNGRTSASTPNMIINSAGNVGIGVLSPSQIFQIGNAGRLRIANNISDYSILGTADTDGGTNTRIVVSGNTRGAPYAGQIDYVATAGGSHIFSTTNSTTERMRIADNGNVSINNGILTINAADFSTGGTKGIIFRSGYDIPNNNNYNCSILTYDNDGNGFCDGLSINGWDGISFCTGANTRNERMKITANGNLILPADKWVYSSDSTRQRIYFGTNGPTYYQGYGNTNDFDINHEFRNHDGTKIMHLDKGGNMILKGVLNCQFITISNTSRDLTGIDIEGTNVGNSNNTTLFCIQGTFTGFHRVYTEDENFNIEDPQKFKNDYEGRIVVSTGKIATDTTDDNDNRENTEWRILQDKEGITIEDALPKIELSRIRKDKRVFGVLGDKRRTNNRAERLIVNSVGEGGIWICNSNGNIENGDYITSSDYLGYGEKQDEIYLCNYTVAKATMDCNFELESNLYNCFEIENGLRVAFIACTYHCG
jgi:hypothetical protein